MHDDDEKPGAYGKSLGKRLRNIRRQKGLSLQDVEAESKFEFKASALGAYERGERAISVPRLQRLARFYHVPVDQMLPVEEHYGVVSGEGEAAAVSERPRKETVTIDLGHARGLKSAEGTMLNRYLEMIQVERQDFNGVMLTIRRDDLRALACILHTTVERVPGVLDEMGLLYTS